MVRLVAKLNVVAYKLPKGFQFQYGAISREFYSSL